MKGELYIYNGQYLTLASISKLENINRSTLMDWYKKTGDMVKAVDGAKKSLAQRNIEYYGEILSLKAIADKEDLKFESLKKFYAETNDIYIAVIKTKEAKFKRNGSIEYHGQMMSITAIANLENLERHSLARHYELTGDIYKAVSDTRIAKEKQNGTILYKGQLMTITGIANLEGIKRDTLKEFYEIYGNIEKAIFITKESQLKRRKTLLRGKEVSYEEISKYFNIPILSLEGLIDEQGISKLEKKHKSEKTTLKMSEDSLYKYCLEHSYNYWVLYHMINDYGKSVEEALKIYLENGQQIPTKWIYEKYDILFKHLALNWGLDSNRIIKIMKEDSCGIGEAITRLIFILNNQNTDIKQIEIDWLQQLYDFMQTLSGSDLEEAEKTFYIDQREKKFISEKDSRIKIIKRQLLLFEFSVIIDIWDTNEISEMMSLCNISREEIEFIITELYKPFDNKVINPSEAHRKRINSINAIIKDDNIGIEQIQNDVSLTEEEKCMIIHKKELLQILCKKENKKRQF